MNPELSIAAPVLPNTLENVYDRYAPYMYGVVYAVTCEHDLSGDILKLIFLELKEDLMQLDSDTSRFAEILKETHELTVRQLEEIRITVPKEKRRLKMATLLATPYSSIRDVAALFGLSVEETKTQLRREMLAYRNVEEAQENEARRKNFRLNQTLRIDQILSEFQNRQYPPLRSV